MDVVVYDKRNDEVLACVNLDGQESICRSDVGIKIFDGIAPVFVESESGIKLKQNAFILNPLRR